MTTSQLIELTMALDAAARELTQDNHLLLEALLNLLASRAMLSRKADCDIDTQADGFSQELKRRMLKVAGITVSSHATRAFTQTELGRAATHFIQTKGKGEELEWRWERTGMLNEFIAGLFADAGSKPSTTPR
jgi:hypothetical protein